METENYKGWTIRSVMPARETDITVVEAIFFRDDYNVKNWQFCPARHTDARSLDLGPDDLAIDIGGHIGTFSRKWHDYCPTSTIVCVEPTITVELIKANVGSFARVIQGCCTYLPWQEPSGDGLPRRITLEQILEESGKRFIHVLKLDCEGFEYDILSNCNSETIDRCRVVLGEYHGGERGRSRLWDIFKERWPYFLYEDNTQLCHFWAYNPYYWWRRHCNG